MVVIDRHGAIPLIVLGAGTVGTVNRDLVVVGSQAVAVGVIVREETTLKHLIWRWFNTRHKVGGREGQLLHLRIIYGCVYLVVELHLWCHVFRCICI